MLKQITRGGELTLSKRAMTILPKVMYIKPFPQVQILNVSDNRLQELSEELIKNLPRLKSFDACDNMIYEVSSKIELWAETLV